MGGHPLNHLTDGELTEIYYGEIAPAVQDHLKDCAECRDRLRQTEDLLCSLLQYPVPEPEEGYEGRVWAELVPRLSQNKTWNIRFLWKPLVFAPALVAVVFLTATVWLVRQGAHHGFGISQQDQARVLSNTLTEHLDRSQVLLLELANAKPGPNVLKNAQEFARDLADENRLLRFASHGDRDETNRVLLEELERVLLSIANAPANFSSDDLAALQRRIDDEGLLFKVRITDSDLRSKERKL